MEFNFSKFLGNFTLISTLVLGSSGLNLCYAMDSEKTESAYTQSDAQSDRKIIDTISEVCIECMEILEKNFEYDIKALNEYETLNLKDNFNKDCEYLEETKKGVCRHFSNYLIKKLRAKGIEAYPLYIIYEEDLGHGAVLYKAGNDFFVADITSDIVAVQEGKTERKKNPKFFGEKLEKFIEVMREGPKALDVIFFLDVDFTDENLQLTSNEDVESKMEVLFLRDKQ